MNNLTFTNLEQYLQAIYCPNPKTSEQGMFMKLVEEIGEVAEVLNIRANRKAGQEPSNEELAKELADVIHYTVAIAAINHIDLASAILEKDKTAAVKYHHPFNLEDYLKKTDVFD